MALQLEVIDKSGAWFYYNQDRLGQGKENVKKLFETNHELMNEIEALVREKAKTALLDEDGLGASGSDDDDFDIDDFDAEV